MEDLPTPLSRVELYLAKACGMDVTVPEAPLSRLEQFLAVIAGDTSVELPTPYSLTEMWLAFVAGITPDPLLEVIGAHYIDNQKVDTRYLAVASGMDGVTLPAAPQNRKEQYWAYIAGNAPIHGVLKYVTGSSFTLTDVVSGIEELQYVYGDTTQQTYSGKNLLNTMTFVKGRIDNGVIGYESGTTSITPTENSITFVTNQTFRGVASSAIEVTASTDYALQFTYDSYEGYISRSINAYDENNDWITVVSVTSNGIFTTPANCKYVRLSFIESGVGTAVIKNLQIEKGSTATSWEKFVGGTASPNPDYPQDINVVTGEQTVKVTGKNLMPRSFASVNDNSRQTNFKIDLPAGTYTLSYDLDSFSFGTNTNFGVNLAFTNNSNIQFNDFVFLTVNSSTATGRKSFTFTITDDASISYNSNIRVTAGDYNRGARIELSNIQIEQGSTATPYEAYQSTTKTVNLGSTELCKIGTYQDYIYKSGDDWYVHKATKDLAISSTSFELSVYNVGGLKCAPLNNEIVGNKISSSTAGAYCSKARNVRPNTAQWSEGCFYENPANFMFAGDADDTASDIANKYSGAKLYYVLATPTDTKITDSTLIGELEGLESLVLPKPTAIGTITATGTNLPMPIKFSYYGSSEE